MKSLIRVSLLLVSVGRLAAGLVAADPNGKAADNPIYAQSLVNDLMAHRSDLLVVGLHGIPAGTQDEVMLACNLDHIGNPDTEFDKASGVRHMTLLEPGADHNAQKFEMTIPLQDSSGGYIGAMVIIFKRKAGESELDLYRKGLKIRDDLAKKIPNFAALFGPMSPA